MSHFYGTLKGNRGEATRAGTKDSGLTTTAASWKGAIRVNLWQDAAGVDRFTIEQTPWQGAGIHEVIAEGVLGQHAARAPIPVLDGTQTPYETERT